MPDRGSQTTMPRSSLPSDVPSAFASVFGIAFAVCSVLALMQIGMIATLAHHVLSEASNGTAVVTASSLYWANLLGGPLGWLLLAVADVLVFALCAWFARRYWLGLLFLPPAFFAIGGAIGAWLLGNPIGFFG